MCRDRQHGVKVQTIDKVQPFIVLSKPAGIKGGSSPHVRVARNPVKEMDGHARLTVPQALLHATSGSSKPIKILRDKQQLLPKQSTHGQAAMSR